ncbi:hypothetical protein EF908_11930 [Streptomyces sp. WAC04770]|nr:hypothetical protein EF908_11930 [Streptomyces sp. WAC04770]
MPPASPNPRPGAAETGSEPTLDRPRTDPARPRTDLGRPRVGPDRPGDGPGRSGDGPGRSGAGPGSARSRFRLRRGVGWARLGA